MQSQIPNFKSAVPDPKFPRGRWDILKVRGILHLLKARPFQFLLQLPFVSIFLLIIIAGLYGAQIPGANIATVVTWTIWWGGVIFTFPLIGRAWCLVCPWAAIGDWVQRLALWRRKEEITLGKRWPSTLRNLYPVIIAFIVITWAEFYFHMVSSPVATAYLAIVILAMAVITALIFERRSFCRYLCPIGGMIGVYSQFSATELRCRDRAVCRECKTKDCLRGNALGYGCPVFEYPETMDTNTYCILCTECIKTCPKDNIAFNVRPLTEELVSSLAPDRPNQGRARRMDEALMVLAILGITIFHALTMTPYWFKIMDVTMMATGLTPGATFTILMMVFIIITIFIYYLFTGVSSFITYAYPLIPLALFFHLSHNVLHLFGEGQRMVNIISDPLGWGWDIFGTARLSLPPIIPLSVIPYIQWILVLIGFGYCIYLAYKTLPTLSAGSVRGFLPVVVMVIALTVAYLWMLSQPMVMRMG